MSDPGSDCERRTHSSKPMRLEARFSQRHKRALLDAAAEVSGIEVPHDLTRVAERFRGTRTFS